MATVEIEQAELETLKSKAKSYEEIQEGIEKFYVSEDGNDNVDFDLINIGEWIASYLGWM